MTAAVGIKRSSGVVGLLTAMILAVACSDRGGPQIRIFDGDNPPPSSSRSGQPVVAQVQSGGTHIVRRGETLYAVARAYGVPIRALISLNSLSAPFRLVMGQRLRIPDSRTHTVRSGETVYGISRQYGVDMSQLVQRNNIAAPFTIRVGQQLAIPGRIVETASVAARPVSAPVESGPVARPAPDGLADEPLDAPLGGSSTGSAPSTPSDTTAVPSGPRAPRQAGRPFEVTDAGYPRVPRKPAEPVKLARTNTPIPQPVARASERFLWPVQGRVISKYGPAGAGLHNDGINIAAPRGTAVKAAENGVVVYSGSDLKGFGNMILVKHADGYLTAYAHISESLVARGASVRRGQAIARVGSTGNVDKPQLHFEIRKGRQAINPINRLAT